MKKFLDVISDVMSEAFAACGYEEKYARVTVSNRPDLCEYQCNGAMAAAKAYKKAPFVIAGEVVEKVKDNPWFLGSVGPRLLIKEENGTSAICKVKILFR